MKKLTFFLAVLICSFQVKADEISYNFDYSLDNEPNTACSDLEDPFESVNRKIFYFNSFLDHIILKPTAKAYGKFVSDSGKQKIGNFVDNIYEPLTTVNYTLQADIDNVLSSFWKFAINTTFGIAGTHNVAAKFGIDHKPQTFGSTLAHYGVSPGPYIVIPILGGTNTRDMWDSLAADDKLNPIKYQLSKNASITYSAVRLIHKRNEIMPFTDHISKNSTDPYAAIRSAMHQRRESVVHYPAGYKCGIRASRLKTQ